MTTCTYKNSRPLTNELGQRQSDVRHIVETTLYELAPGFIEMSHETMSMDRLDNLIYDLTDYMFYLPQADLRAKIHEELKDWFECHQEGERW